jgi:hypothetical protein
MRRLAKAATQRLQLGGVVRSGRLLSDSQPSVEHLEPTCVDQRASLPAAWRASSSLVKEIDNITKPVNITAAAESAARNAFQELVDLMKRPGMVQELGTDALEPIINGAFAGSNMQDVREVGLSFGQEILLTLARVELDTDTPTCAELRDSDLPTLVQYGQYLQLQMPPNATMRAIQDDLENATNAALDNCSSLEDYLGFDPRDRLGKYPKSVQEASSSKDWIDPIYSMVLQAVDTLGLLGIQRLHMPNGALDYVASFWAYLFDYPFPHAREYIDGLFDPAFEQNSYIVTHLAYVVTGYQRYALTPNDAPWLFHYLRENFYPAVESGHLDLYAEFLDNFRQYGCTSGDDQQTRDGTLVLLNHYQEAGGRWMDYRDPDDDAILENYDVMHKAWTAYVGLHQRVLETPPPGISYFQQAQEAVKLALVKAKSKRNSETQAFSSSFSIGSPMFLIALCLLL